MFLLLDQEVKDLSYYDTYTYLYFTNKFVPLGKWLITNYSVFKTRHFGFNQEFKFHFIWPVHGIVKSDREK